MTKCLRPYPICPIQPYGEHMKINDVDRLIQEYTTYAIKKHMPLTPLLAAAENINAYESLTFNDTVSCKVIPKWNVGLKEDMDAQSDVYMLSNGCMKSSDKNDDYYWEYTPGLEEGKTAKGTHDGPIFDDVLSVFNISTETDLLSKPSEIVAPKLMKKMADIYFTRVTKNSKSTFSLSPRQMALWTSQKEDHTSDWLRTVLISGLGQTMNACSKVFAGDIYGDHAVSYAGIIGIKHRHNVVRDTFVDICYRSGISAGTKCAAIGYGFLPFSFSSLGELEADAVTLLKRIRKYSMTRDIGARAAVYIFNRISFTIVKGCVVIDAAQLKRGKYMAKCAAIKYGFLPFSFSSFGELEADTLTLLKRIRKFSIAQDIEARAAIHIFNRISFAIPKGVGRR
ncbi:hypothetical protein Tco_0951093 [Tanacetum coccineum]|uniref:Uncharacterized protein n=1 Tax=Tanacetum coccineum TaxID=301880 RepID=A0ABQ5DUW6_9ASTR